MSKKRTGSVLVIGIAVVLVIGVLGNLALAQEEDPEPEAIIEEKGLVVTSDVVGFGGPGLIVQERFGDNSTWQENLAEALGITVEELQAAQEQAFAATVADAVTEGTISQEQADRLLAGRALRAYLDYQAILAAALDMTADELEAAFADDQSLVDLMVEKGIDSEELQASIRTGYEAAVQQAVTDGVITQEQADEVLAEDALLPFHFGLHGPGHDGPGFRRGGPGFGLPFFPNFGSPESAVPDVSITEFNG